MKTQLSSLLAIVALSSQLSAHPTGHSEGFAHNFFHFVSSPDHLIFFGVALAAGMATFCALRNARSKN